MTGAQFKRYLAKLRALRPAFKEHIAQQAELQAIAEQVALEEAREQAKKLNPAETQTPRQTLAAVPKPEIQKGDKLFNLARKPVADYHRVFLSQHSQAIYDTTNTIQPQPHRFGGLLYSHPSPLRYPIPHQAQARHGSPAALQGEVCQSQPRASQQHSLHRVLRWRGCAPAQERGSEVQQKGADGRGGREPRPLDQCGDGDAPARARVAQAAARRGGQRGGPRRHEDHARRHGTARRRHHLPAKPVPPRVAHVRRGGHDGPQADRRRGPWDEDHRRAHRRAEAGDREQSAPQPGDADPQPCVRFQRLPASLTSAQRPNARHTANNGQ
ncbi:hypothetical protein C8J57DRAFT_663938 [Mycena rebaudengoi]|nr:hypothetical protein C8J57DRAFT_663938 [Mycena rebaudengoi]